MLNRLREGKHTPADVEEIKALAHTDTSQWPSDYVKLYVTNALANKENDKCLKQLQEQGNEIYVINAKDSKKDVKTGTYNVNIPANAAISTTASLTKLFKICIGARVMLTNNLDIEDRLINGSMGTVKYIDRVRNNKRNGVIYVQFEDPEAGNKLKNTRLRGDLKGCVPIQSKPIQFQYKHNKSNITVERKQFPLVLGHAITIHKSQGSTLEHMSGNMDQTTKNGKGLAPVGSGMLYTLLSRAKCRNNLQLLNFNEQKHMKVNEAAVQDMERRTVCYCAFTR